MKFLQFFVRSPRVERRVMAISTKNSKTVSWSDPLESIMGDTSKTLFAATAAVAEGKEVMVVEVESDLEVEETVVEGEAEASDMATQDVCYR